MSELVTLIWKTENIKSYRIQDNFFKQKRPSHSTKLVYIYIYLCVY